MAYNAYEQFIKAAEKYPRWTNIRRRPTESNAGKILRSIYEEHQNIDQAIQDYKKEFFLKYYEGKEDEILACLYIAQIGTIEDLTQLTIVDPVYKITDEESVFFTDDSYAFYHNGYIALYDTNDENKLSYMYKGNPYTADLIYTPIWNVFDEFAWWFGLERFDKESNVSLRQRCFNQFINRPNSTEQGIKNAIINAASVQSTLYPEDIQIIAPDETSLSWKNAEGLTLYEEISRTNRDIARTRKWDIDYWDNAFRQLQYLPHVWDAEMEICQDGVGYHDALKVSTVRDAKQKSTTKVKIKGYKLTNEEIEAYILNHNAYQNIELNLKRYNDTVIPLDVEYRIIAEDLIPVSNPEQILFYFYRQYIGKHEYPVDTFVKEWNGLTRTRKNVLQPNKEYRLIFSAADPKGQPMEIRQCKLIEGETVTPYLEEDVDREFLFRGGRIVNASVLFHGIKVADFMHPVNIQDNPQESNGIILTNPLKNGSFDINLHDWGQRAILPDLNIDIDENSGWNEITGYIAYIKPNKFTYDKNTNQYISADFPLTSFNRNTDEQDILCIDMPVNTCRQLTLHIGAVKETTTANADINVFIDGIRDEQKSRPRTNVSKGYDFSFQQNDIGHAVTIEIKRYNSDAIYVDNIKVQSYSLEIVTDNGIQIPYTNHMKIPSVPANTHLTCIIHNNGNPVSPLIRSCHIGSWQYNKQYTTKDFFTTVDNAELEIDTNCNVVLYNVTDQTVVENFDVHYTYKNEGTQKADLVLDLSIFDKINKTEPAVFPVQRRGENAYYCTLQPGEELRSISIHGYGYKLDRVLSLADIVSINENESLYYAKSFNGFIIPSKDPLEIKTIPYDMIHFGDRIDIVSNENDVITGCFVISGESESALSYTGAFDYLYLYDPKARQYIIDGKTSVFQKETTNIRINPLSASPMPKENALLSYKIAGVSPTKSVSVFYGTSDKRRYLSIDQNEELTIETTWFDTIQHNNLSLLSVAANTTQQMVPLSNTINLSGFTDVTGHPVVLSRYLITPPDTMEVSYIQKTYQQDQNEDGSFLSVMNNGFNKLYHSNVVSIDRIKIGDTIYDTADSIGQILTLLSEPGIICWKDASLYGELIEQIDYTYQEPVSLHFKNIQDMYNKSGYQIPDSVASVNKDTYIVYDVADQDSFDIEEDRFITTPDQFVVSCDNPCFRATVSGHTVTISKIAEDLEPVIHNGFYYKNGKEYYFFANEKNKSLDKFDGVSIEQGEIVDNILYLYQEAVNYLENAKMETTQMTTHCLIDFAWPKAQTNIDSLGQIGACESFSAWEDKSTTRSLAVYKNGIATHFAMQPEGYALLDITKYLKGHTTISCLYTGNLTFMLAQEIRILQQQALKNVYCKPIQKFVSYHDIAYCIADTDTSMYRYYLVVQGNGILDEILIHDFTEPDTIAAHHKKAIDKLGINVEEKNMAPSTTVSSEYSTDFIRYHQTETLPDGIMQTGMTADWNITRIGSFELESCRTNKFLLRNNGLIAQSDHAFLETKPVKVNNIKSVREIAFSINQYISGVYQGFTIIAYGSNVSNGEYRELARADDANLLSFRPNDTDQYFKFQIIAQENKAIVNLSLFAVYRETAIETLSIYPYTEGSAVTKVFHMGAAGNYKFRNIICEEGLDQYDHIYIRGAKQNGTEYIWTPWKDTKDHPEFYNYELFQYKICMQGKDSKLKIKSFEFEVL